MDSDSDIKQKGIVIDLDGTLLLCNTFHKYFSYILKYTILRFKIWQVLYIIGLLLGRKLRLYSHSYFKRKILSLPIPSKDSLNKFVDDILKYLNLQVLEIFKEYKMKGYYTCLATAAPLLYSKLIAERYEFDIVCATQSNDSSDQVWVETIRDEKLNAVSRIFNQKGVSIDVVVTDHSDDIPLMAKALNANYLVNPSNETLKLIESEKIEYCIV